MHFELNNSGDSLTNVLFDIINEFYLITCMNSDFKGQKEINMSPHRPLWEWKYHCKHIS